MPSATWGGKIRKRGEPGGGGNGAGTDGVGGLCAFQQRLTKAVGLVRALPAKVVAPADLVRGVVQRAVRDEVVQEEHRAARHLARDNVLFQVALEHPRHFLLGQVDVPEWEGVELCQGCTRLTAQRKPKERAAGAPSAADAARVLGGAPRAVAAADDLHAAVLHRGVQQGHPGGELQRRPALFVEIGNVLVPRHGGLLLVGRLRTRKAMEGRGTSAR